jgi:hypothetical protein
MRAGGQWSEKEIVEQLLCIEPNKRLLMLAARSPEIKAVSY